MRTKLGNLATWATTERQCLWWALPFGAALVLAVLAGSLAEFPGAVAIILAVTAITISVAVMFKKGVTVASVTTLTIAIYALCVRIQTLNDAPGYWVAIGLAAALTVLALIYTSNNSTHKFWVSIAFLIVLFGAIGLAVL